MLASFNVLYKLNSAPGSAVLSVLVLNTGILKTPTYALLVITFGLFPYFNVAVFSLLIRALLFTVA